MNENLFSARKYRRYYQNITPLFKTRQVQAYLMVVLSLFTISFFGFFAIRPTLKTIATLQRQIADRSFVDQKLEDKINSLILAQEEYQRIGSSLPFIYSLLPENAEFPTLLRKLEMVTDQNQAIISAVSFDPIILYGETADSLPVQPATTADNIPSQLSAEVVPLFFNLTLKGKYQNLTTLLDRLTKLDRLITIHSVTMSTAGITTDSELSLGIESKSYYYK